MIHNHNAEEKYHKYKNQKPTHFMSRFPPLLVLSTMERKKCSVISTNISFTQQVDVVYENSYCSFQLCILIATSNYGCRTPTFYLWKNLLYCIIVESMTFYFFESEKQITLANSNCLFGANSLQRKRPSPLKTQLQNPIIDFPGPNTVPNILMGLA